MVTFYGSMYTQKICLNMPGQSQLWTIIKTKFIYFLIETIMTSSYWLLSIQMGKRIVQVDNVKSA